MKPSIDLALQRAEYCFRHIKVRGYTQNDDAKFNHLHSDQYCQFLYYLANSNWQLGGDPSISDKLILLNKALHGCWFSYKGKLPDIFLISHPVGTVLGNANYSNYLVVLQNVTVNTSVDENGNPAPHLGKGLYLASGSKIIGNGNIGDNVSIGVDAVVYKQNIQSNSLVYRNFDGKQVIRSNYKPIALKYFYVEE